MSAFTFFPSLYLLLIVAFYTLVVYPIISIIAFMKRRTMIDQQKKNEKLDQLIQLLKDRERQS